MQDLGRTSLGTRDFPVTKDNEHLLLWGWYSGWSAPAILWLTKYRNQDEASQEVQWLRNPVGANPPLEDKIAEIQGFCDTYFNQGWSRVLRAVQRFLSYIDLTEKEQAVVAYEGLIPCISRGVSSKLAVQFLEGSMTGPFPGDRTQAQILADWYEQNGITSMADIQSGTIRPAPTDLTTRSLDPMGITKMEMATASTISNWLIEYQKFTP